MDAGPRGAAGRSLPPISRDLGHLATRDGAIVTKDELLERFWPDVNINDNTLTRAVADIRKALGDSATSPTTCRRWRGAAIDLSAVPHQPHQPHQPYLPHPPHPPERIPSTRGAGTLALESLDLSRLDQAIFAFERAVANLPSYAPAYAGLANAYLLRFENSRFSNSPDRDAVRAGRDRRTAGV